MPSAQSDAAGPSRSTMGGRSTDTTRIRISVGTAANQFVDCPRHFMARQATMASSDCGADCSPSAISQYEEDMPVETADDSSSWQQSTFTMRVGASQHAPCCWLVAEVSAGHVTMNPAARALASANSGGRTPCRRAHATRSASVWQQHDRQQRSAESHPHFDAAQRNNSPLVTGR